MPHETVPGRRVTKVWPVEATTRPWSSWRSSALSGECQRVVLESTSDYWRPFYYLLEAAGLTVWLVNAAQVQERPGPPEDRQDRRGVAGQAGRALDAVPVAGAHRADAPGAGSGPGPVRPGRGPGPGQAADREAARGRPDQDLLGAHRRARGVRPGHDRGADRRAAQPEGAGRAGPGPRPGPQRAAGGALRRPVHRPPRPAGPAAAGPARRADRAHRARSPPCSRPRSARSTPPQADTDTPTGDGGDGDDDGRREPGRGQRWRTGAAGPGPLRPGRRATVRHPRRRPGHGPGGHRGDRAGHERVRHPQRLCSWAKVAPRTVQSGRKTGRARTGGATPTSRPRWPRWPWAPRRPTPSSANATGG